MVVSDDVHKQPEKIGNHSTSGRKGDKVWVENC